MLQCRAFIPQNVKGMNRGLVFACFCVQTDQIRSNTAILGFELKDRVSRQTQVFHLRSHDVQRFRCGAQGWDAYFALFDTEYQGSELPNTGVWVTKPQRHFTAIPR